MNDVTSMAAQRETHSEERPRIAHFGAFDHDSYGDLLFPLLAEWRWPEAQWMHIAPTATRPNWPDARPVVAALDVLSGGERVDAVLLGGGDVVQDGRWWTSTWNTERLPGPLALPVLWGGAAILSCRRRVPLCWNAPGIPHPMDGAAARLLRWSADAAHRVAVRDLKSLEFLEQTGWAGQGEVVPDTAFDLARMWPAEDLLADQRAAAARAGLPPGRAYLVVSCGEGSLPGAREMEDAAGAVAAVARELKLSPLLLDLSPWSSNGGGAPGMAAALTGATVVDSRSLRECAALIAHSALYIGTSLHGLIAALAYGRPALAFAPRSRPACKKIVGTLSQCGLAGVSHVERWDQVAGRARDAMRMPPARWTEARDTVLKKLDDHWDRTRRALLHGQPPPPAHFETLQSGRQATWPAFTDLMLAR